MGSRGCLARLGAGVALISGVVFSQQAVFRSTTQLVVAPVTVKDDGGAYVTDLSADDFSLLDDGVSRQIQMDSLFVPISLVVAVQTSTKIPKMGGMFEPLIAGDRGEAAVVTYDDDVRVTLPFTRDAKVLKATLPRLASGGSNSRMVDAVDRGVRMLEERGPVGRRVLIVIGESRDRGSRAALADVVTLAQRDNVAVYVLDSSAQPPELPIAGNINLFSILAEIGRLAKTNAGEVLARYTGGREVSFGKQRGLEQVVSDIGEELHSQYLLSFTPTDASKGEFHRIAVSVRGREGLKISTRPGYWIGGSE